MEGKVPLYVWHRNVGRSCTLLVNLERAGIKINYVMLNETNMAKT